MSIILAIPSKGRMKDDAVLALAKAGIDVLPSKDARAYRSSVKGRDDIEVALMSASEIARELAAGSIDLGVTGEDLVREFGGELGSENDHRRPSRLRQGGCGRGRAGSLARR